MRRGLIVLSETTTATHCGDCPCSGFALETMDECSRFEAVKPIGERTSECLASERAFNDAVREAALAGARAVAEAVLSCPLPVLLTDGRTFYGSEATADAIHSAIARLESEGR